ncbi:MAG: hypothetical protein J3Q66DRAFT_404123 [Benniella sp.]|nr:MAG: hypothetical protein J3Q66DRAFT_404123 [Benniella sp.]
MANTETPSASVDLKEIGLIFVHEYYTIVNQDPTRLHCFYDKNSIMSHGTEGRDATYCEGRQASEIHSHIVDLGYEDCRVLVRSVDSHKSLNGGIMIQVLGEMSNQGGRGPSQRFAQTFFLAEQPNGYYVLNDIFRYLNDYNDEVEAEAEHDPTEDVEALAVVPPEPAAPVEEVVPVVEAEIPVEEVTIIPAPVEVPEPVQPVEAPAAEEEKAAPETKEVVEEKKAPVEEKKPVEKKYENKRHDKKSKSDRKESKKDDNKEAKEAKKEAAKHAEPAEKPKSEPVDTNETTFVNDAPAAPIVTPSAPVAPAEPAKPKTWANMAASNSAGWGVHAAPVKGESIIVLAPSPTPSPKPQAPQANVSRTRPQSQGQRSNGREDVLGIYVKNVTERMTLEHLREAFGKFGAVKNVEFTPRNRNCAYVDFETADAVQAALKQSKVEVGSEVVSAEERRPAAPSGGRPSHYQNGSGSNGHQGPHSGHRGGRSTRGGYDRKSIQKPEKAAPTVAVN